MADKGDSNSSGKSNKAKRTYDKPNGRTRAYYKNSRGAHNKFALESNRGNTYRNHTLQDQYDLTNEELHHESSLNKSDGAAHAQSSQTRSDEYSRHYKNHRYGAHSQVNQTFSMPNGAGSSKKSGSESNSQNSSRLKNSKLSHEYNRDNCDKVSSDASNSSKSPVHQRDLRHETKTLDTGTSSRHQDHPQKSSNNPSARKTFQKYQGTKDNSTSKNEHENFSFSSRNEKYSHGNSSRFSRNYNRGDAHQNDIHQKSNHINSDYKGSLNPNAEAFTPRDEASGSAQYHQTKSRQNGSASDSMNLNFDKNNSTSNRGRGQIVSGRYIRKHSNPAFSQPTHKSRSDFEQPYNDQVTSDKSRNGSRAFMQSESTRYKNRDQPSDDQVNSDKSRNSSRAFMQSESTQYKNENFNKRYQSVSQTTSRESSAVVYRYSRTSNGKVYKSSEYSGRRDDSTVSSFKENKANQRELLIERLSKGDCECLICCEQIRVRDQMWHCLSCFHVLHLRCIRKWARSASAAVEGGGWRCPACQNIVSGVPFDYMCFCGKRRDPEVNYHLTPHSCGEVCSRKRQECSHTCKELCHPGPCPPCNIVVPKSCACGKTFKTNTCSHSVEETCSSICDKPLNCGTHHCPSACHPGKCLDCEQTVEQNCYCKKNTRSVPCTTTLHFACPGTCDKPLPCGHHTCPMLCHDGPCQKCATSVDVIKTCPCGKATLEQLIQTGKAVERKECVDPVPMCGEVCDKVLSCGPKDSPHRCQSPCHDGPCPSCPLTTTLKCRCSAFTREFPCSECSAPDFQYTCERRCNRRLQCGRHKCLKNCCTLTDHRCEMVCNRKLSCGNHHCEDFCHGGNCKTCWNVSFNELHCECGAAVTYPPVPCGTKPPECTEPCSRHHSCGHPVRHVCHSDATCPPCTALTIKWCYGKHKQCPSVLCFLDGVSCGKPCDKALSCGQHQCPRTCHEKECLKEGVACTQPCPKTRPSCPHNCGSPCHPGKDCPESPCRAQVTLSCPCGHRSETMSCHESTKSQRLVSLATRMQDIKEGQSVNLNDILPNSKKTKNNKLQCNEECSVLERNRRLAVALQIQNPELSPSPGPPQYSEFLKTEARKSPALVQEVYDKIAQLVALAKESKQKCRSWSFPPMNRDHRRVVHELAEFFGCETQSYDEEPKKNVVVTAHKTKCWLPFVSIMTVVQRDMGFRKGPAPLIPPTAKNSAPAPPKKKIDYFDFKE